MRLKRIRQLFVEAFFIFNASRVTRYSFLLEVLLLRPQVETVDRAVIGQCPRPARACINSQVDRLTLLAKVELRQEEGIDPELLELLG